MNVLFTVGVLAAAALWILAVLRRLTRLRSEVTLAWRRLETEQTNAAVKTVYNKHVTAYNAALASFPAYLVGPLFGFKPARTFN